MAFGYRYWMVFLPQIDPDSYLMFVHNPAGSTKLRSYASGRERVITQPLLAQVFADSQIGVTRHEVEPHRTDDHAFWFQKTLEFNRRYLGHTASRAVAAAAAQGSGASSGEVAGRASRGSQRQVQDYINQRPDELSAAILDQLPPRLRELRASIRWVSPLASENYREYRDADFLERVGLAHLAQDLAAFWPGMGPSWDALGVISTPLGNMKPGVILVEAKSHIPEIYGGGCKASAASLVKIEAALESARTWCGCETREDWLGPLYQSANRIAHLFFLREQMRVPAWLVNLYFTGDPIGPTDRSAWEAEVARVKARLGLTLPLQNTVEIYLAALDRISEKVTSPPAAPKEQTKTAPPIDIAATDTNFYVWARQWMEIADFNGPHLPDADRRIRRVLDLWDLPVPEPWQRGMDPQLLTARYRRGDLDAPHTGEHSIEHGILGGLEEVSCLGGTVVDGINAMPLARDCSGGRRGNVEADLFLLVRIGGSYQLVLCEVKHSSNTAWYAAIENLRQLKLLHLSAVARRLFHERCPGLSLPAEIPIRGLVLAPGSFYRQAGQKANAVPHAGRMLREFTLRTGIAAHMAIWDAGSRTIRLQDAVG
jgi:hypothetical protein